MRLARRAGFWTLFWLLALVQVVAALELFGRAGIPRTPFYVENEVVRRVSGSDVPLRVLLLGDSFTAANSASWAEKFRAKVESQNGVVLNLARSGEGLPYHLQQLRAHGEEFRPLVILLNYFVGNDLADALRGTSRSGGWLGKSYVWQNLQTLISEIDFRRRLAIADKIARKLNYLGAPPWNRLLLEVAVRKPRYFTENLLMDTPDMEKAWAINQQLLREAATISRELGAVLLVQFFPTDLQVESDGVEFYRSIGFQLERDFKGWDLPQRKFAQFCKEAALDCFDFLPELRKAKGRRLYLPQDIHWGPAGNEVALQLMLRRLNEALLKTRDVAGQ